MRRRKTKDKSPRPAGRGLFCRTRPFAGLRLVNRAARKAARPSRAQAARCGLATVNMRHIPKSGFAATNTPCEPRPPPPCRGDQPRNCGRALRAPRRHATKRSSRSSETNRTTQAEPWRHDYADSPKLAQRTKASSPKELLTAKSPFMRTFRASKPSLETGAIDPIDQKRRSHACGKSPEKDIPTASLSDMHMNGILAVKGANRPPEKSKDSKGKKPVERDGTRNPGNRKPGRLATCRSGSRGPRDGRRRARKPGAGSPTHLKVTTWGPRGPGAR